MVKNNHNRYNKIGANLTEEDNKHVDSEKINIKKSDEFEHKSCRQLLIKNQRKSTQFTTHLTLLYDAYINLFSQFYSSKAQLITHAVNISYELENLIKEFTKETFGLDEIKLRDANCKNSDKLRQFGTTLPKECVEKYEELIKNSHYSNRAQVIRVSINNYLLFMMMFNKKYSKKIELIIDKFTN
jgi:aromatic ring-opening dioxygenase LigB subunit